MLYWRACKRMHRTYKERRKSNSRFCSALSSEQRHSNLEPVGIKKLLSSSRTIHYQKISQNPSFAVSRLDLQMFLPRLSLSLTFRSKRFHLVAPCSLHDYKCMDEEWETIWKMLFRLREGPWILWGRFVPSQPWDCLYSKKLGLYPVSL